MKISKDIVKFLRKQGFVIVSTLDSKGHIHCSAKGIVGIEDEGRVFVIDLYHGNTSANLKANSTVSITAIDEHTFEGYTCKGKAKFIQREKAGTHIIKEWEDKVIERISNRVIRGVKDKKNIHHPESALPHPKYFIEIDVEEIVDLTPAHLKPPTK